uniref:CPG4 domain-containing protein n=1 Tax=Steinernema glaseri TaxID=37863 RepID=A0A1I8AD03_9BILA
MGVSTVVGVLLALISVTSAAYLDLPIAFCEHYVECEAVSRLEERLCIGNTRMMPFWLPPLSRSPTKTRCYHLLKPEYEKLDRLERQFESQLLACMTEQVLPLTDDDQAKCDKVLLKRAPKFSFSNRSLDYIPTNCFQGKKRIDRQCGKLRSCCSSFQGCSDAVATSHLAVAITTMKQAIREIGRTCDQGLDVRAGRQPVFSNDEEGAYKQPTGNITVSIHHNGSVSNDQLPIQREGYLHVRFHQQPNDDIRSNEQLGQVSNPVPLKKDNFTRVTFPKKPNTVPSDSESTTLTEKEGSLTFESAIPPRKEQKHFDATTLPPATEDKTPVTSRPQVSEIPPVAARSEPEPKAQPGKPIIEGPAGITQLGQHLNKLVIQNSGRPKAEHVHDAVESSVSAGPAVSQEPITLIDNSLAELERKEHEHTKTEEIVEDPVTSGAILFISERTTQAVRANAGDSTTPVPRTKLARGCGRRRLAGVKTAENADSINSILSEAGDIPEEDANELKGLFETWYRSIKEKLQEAKKNSTAPILTDAYDHVLRKLDNMSDKFFGQFNSTDFEDSEYPEDDANISNTICDPTAVDPENETKENETLSIASTTEEATGLMIEKAKNENEVTKWDNEEYKKEIKQFREMSARHRNAMFKEEDRTLSKCDHFLRCRHQVTTMLDKCSALQGHQSAIFQSTESLLNNDEDPCNGENFEDINELYEMVIARNSKLRKCLRKDEIALEGEKEATCATLVKQKEDTDDIVKAFMNTTYDSTVACYDTVNVIQERCYQLRDCCPNFDSCRESSHDSENERNILEKTATINANNHQCVREQMRDTLAKLMVDVLQPGAKKITMKQRLEGKLKLKKNDDIQTEASVDVDPIVDIVDKWYPLDE